LTLPVSPTVLSRAAKSNVSFAVRAPEEAVEDGWLEG
jgi:hypothetical protein